MAGGRALASNRGDGLAVGGHPPCTRDDRDAPYPRQDRAADRRAGMTMLADKVVWITGASSGVGEARPIAASRRGALRVLTARRCAELERVRGLCADPSRVA